MDRYAALRTLESLRSYCHANKLGLYVVGSVAYTGALMDHAIFSQCDDLDCILIYSSIDQLHNFPFFKLKGLYNLAENILNTKNADLFSSKPVIDGIKVSADFISLDYFNKLADEKFLQNNSYRIKFTDSRENPINEYRSFTGVTYIYHKEFTSYYNCFLYKLPIRIWHNDECYTGALYNKFIHNPAPIVQTEEIMAIHNRLLARYKHHFQRCVASCPTASLMSAMLFKDRFSSQTIDFLNKLAYLQEQYY